MPETRPSLNDWESYADRQIREAIERGEFDDLPGKGKPIPGLDRPHDELWWVKEKVRRENLSVLPRSLELQKEAEETFAAIARSRTEARVRLLAEELNGKIREAHRRPADGPPLRLSPYDVDDLVARWRASRPAPSSTAPPKRRRFFSREPRAGG